MLGVVLWSDASDRKAVIWCEDQGDLAYVKPSDDVLRTGDFFDAGDLVQFEMEVSQSTRVAHNPRLVIEKVGPALPDVLRDAAQTKTPSARRRGQVVSFSPWTEQAKVACS
ncbi:hypothetical protein CEP88_03875 [Roseobacter denitrificans]|uniref:Uncharacterized protein n=1 Tax=Roseobacter denitrificans (strain ATCC 33942 / OCh 114) TaxID=375451 RepID=Q165K1_ROSDO|nr:hypothetical protein [Roseobacter denitrificans]ABG32342.1 hypothetical protein RD1_2814 [Roseobacter denitrificans OCh 114]AVL51821.1 hypothetical protein CEP88_03875 [Roseobacter denitrificans]SFF80581.1 hypothetical protein SAMN05443635_102307 [Roseobacter denitrificans OCh 114]